MNSPHEIRFAWLWEHLPEVGRLPLPIQQYQFAPPRKWRFDFAWPAQLVAVELHGGQWSGGRHVRGGGLAADCEKMRAAVVAGWAVLPFVGDDLTGPDGGARVAIEVADFLRRIT